MTLSILFFSCTSTQKNNDVCGDVRTPANAEQCAILFPQKNIKTRISEMTDPEILNHLDLLVIEKLKIDSNIFTPSQKELALEYFKKDLNEIISKDKKYFKVFQQKFTEKSKDYNKITKSKDKEKRDEDKEKQRIIEDSFPDAFNEAKQKIIFHKIKPGKFMMGEIGSQVEKVIDEPFSMMSTQFTQMMWARLKIATGEADINKINPSKNKTGTDSIKVDIKGIIVEMKPDHPVEQVSWNEIIEFIQKLNDLSKLDDPKTQNLLKKLIPDHQKNDIYDLPTSEQWEFVMRDRGNANNEYFDKADGSEISKYAWYDKNSNNETHAVAQLLPRMIDGKPFFDLVGNVWEWNKNLYDPAGSDREYRGGSFYSYADFLRSHFRSGYIPDYHSFEVGFRLVRNSR